MLDSLEPRLHFAIPGDATRDGIVDSADFTALAIVYNTFAPDSGADLNGDNRVNALDFNQIATHYGQESANRQLARGIDERIEGANGETAFWSSRSPWVRNPNHFLADVDFSFESPLVPAFDEGNGIVGGGARLISPWHVLQDTHYATAGSLLFTKNGQEFWRNVVQNIAIGVDQSIGLLDEPIFDIEPATFLADGWYDLFEESRYGFRDGSGIPVVFFDKEEKLLIGEVETMMPFFSEVRIRLPQNAQRAAYFESADFGDSGNGAYVVKGSTAINIFGRETFGGGPNHANYLSGIQGAMDQTKPGFVVQTVSLWN